ncbi:MAG: hypothetical protein J2P22_18315 [Nocardioides sp.]|nr:hypothetical protein [Nocardioides sp.]
MTALLVLLLLIIAAMGAWSLIDPQAAWRASQGRLLRNPSAAQLTKGGALMQRVIGAVVLVVSVVTLLRL